LRDAAFISLGYNYLKIAINCIDEMEKQGNKDSVWSSGEHDDVELDRIFENGIKWSDRNMAIPILFNFYHGVELILKGLILRCGGELPSKRKHDLNYLLSILSSTQDAPDMVLTNFFSELISYDPNGFFKSNNKEVSKYYELLKYPELKDETWVSTLSLKGQEDVGLNNFLKVRDFAEQVKLNIRKWLTHKHSLVT
jgi:HEPN domain-containing protein